MKILIKITRDNFIKWTFRKESRDSHALSQSQLSIPTCQQRRRNEFDWRHDPCSADVGIHNQPSFIRQALEQEVFSQNKITTIFYTWILKMIISISILIQIYFTKDIYYVP